jgi:hypothetical protein
LLPLNYARVLRVDPPIDLSTGLEAHALDRRTVTKAQSTAFDGGGKCGEPANQWKRVLWCVCARDHTDEGNRLPSEVASRYGRGKRRRHRTILRRRGEVRIVPRNV